MLSIPISTDLNSGPCDYLLGYVHTTPVSLLWWLPNQYSLTPCISTPEWNIPRPILDKHLLAVEISYKFKKIV